ncbi:SEC-C motif-containing protein [Azospirillum oryzae]|uniref:SEC-C motif-containing protein n=1 Tax=Azospirillum oryzae TaxID=286727 RepID=A0A1X7DLY0_9PROT|nr:YchJ family metal-binding protein [Azospirillum oryzae]SMF17830.1 SEC-C motif-containing protein [Azospirillum oryzae]
MSSCPCCSGRSFEDCCGPILAGEPAPTAEALMRSRYTAFVRHELDHVERTHAPEIRDDFNRGEAERVAEESEWQRLDILRAAEEGDSAVVEFQIQFRKDGKDMRHHERASFRREDGRWLYVSGEVNPKGEPRRVVKVGRNEPCPCGSGKKYKACCGK